MRVVNPKLLNCVSRHLDREKKKEEKIFLAWISTEKQTLLILRWRGLPHQTDILWWRCVLRRCRPALGSDRSRRSPPRPSGSGRRPSFASAWRRPGGRPGGWHGKTLLNNNKINTSTQWCSLAAHKLLKWPKCYYWEGAHLSLAHTHTTLVCLKRATWIFLFPHRQRVKCN